jgi:2-amino-4-hydroxy-6-hydroxymethyldihydropteridine diphosphokinase
MGRNRDLVDEIVIAVGSNKGQRRRHLCSAYQEVNTLMPIRSASPVYLSEPVGPSQRNFLNAVWIAETDKDPHQLLATLKEIEQAHGRNLDAPRWSARSLDLDIISYDSLVIQSDTLIIPHSAYRQRLFVLLPLRDLRPDWSDPATDQPIDELIARAPRMHIRRTPLTWQTTD